MRRSPRPRKRHHGLQSVPHRPPGTLVAPAGSPPSTIDVIGYGPTEFNERTLRGPEEIKPLLGASPVIWINVIGLGDAETIRRLGQILELHELALEDVLNPNQRPKVDDYHTRYFIVTREPEQAEPLTTDQISIFLGSNFVISFQQRSGDWFEHIRDRIRKGAGRIRERGPDYLAYALLDAVVDGYFPVLERFGERLETLEDELVGKATVQTIAHVHAMKRDLLTVRRALWPQRDALNILIRDESDLITVETRLHLRDCYDHCIRILDLAETYRELCADLIDLYLSSASNRLNEVIKVLTVIATIFMPLTFIAGIYGMNFDPDVSPWNMPELRWYLGYPFALLLMGLTTLAMLWYFLAKGWIRLWPRREDATQVAAEAELTHDQGTQGGSSKGAGSRVASGGIDARRG